MVLSHGDNDDVKSSTSSVGPSPARGQSAGSGVVSRVRVDVLASRLPAANRRSSGGAGGSGLRESRQSSVAATSVVSSALSLSSVAAMERQLGHPLKLDASGTHIILSKEELAKVRDKETLQFLEQNSSMFVKYYQELAAAEKEVTEAEAEQNGENGESNRAGGGTDHRFKPVDASEIAKHVEALYNEITTFITAIDYEGQSYQLTLDEHGDLRVPLPTTEDGEGDAAENDVANLGDFTEEDVRAFNKEFHFMDEHKEGDDDRDASAASVAYSVSPPPLDVKNPFRSVSPDHDSDTSSVVMGSMAPTEVGDGDAGGEAKPSVSDLRTRLANERQGPSRRIVRGGRRGREQKWVPQEEEAAATESPDQSASAATQPNGNVWHHHPVVRLAAERCAVGSCARCRVRCCGSRRTDTRGALCLCGRTSALEASSHDGGRHHGRTAVRGPGIQ